MYFPKPQKNRVFWGLFSKKALATELGDRRGVVRAVEAELDVAREEVGGGPRRAHLTGYTKRGDAVRDNELNTAEDTDR